MVFKISVYGTQPILERQDDMKILNFGSLNIDYVYRVKRFARPGETVRSKSLRRVCGGKGLNQSIALARGGGQVCHAGNLGKDDGAILLDQLSAVGVDTSLIKSRDYPSGHAIIQVEDSGQNCIMLCSGANFLVSSEQIKKILFHFGKGDLIILQNEINLLDEIIEQAYDRGMKIALNPSPMSDNIFGLPIKKVDILFVNEIEAAGILNEKNICKEDLLQKLSERFPETMIVLTLGRKGAAVAYHGADYYHGIYDVPVVDTTGAGDTFTGFFLAGFSKGKNIEECLELASKASSLCVSRKGSSDSIPDLSEVENMNLKLI